MDRSEDESKRRDEDEAVTGSDPEGGEPGEAGSGPAEAPHCSKLESALVAKNPPRWVHNQDVGLGRIRDALLIAKEGLERQISHHQAEIQRLTAVRNRMTKSGKNG